MSAISPLSGDKPTFGERAATAAFDPLRALHALCVKIIAYSAIQIFLRQLS
jgi:hypothetical protein